MQGLDELYREVILDHYRTPHGSQDVSDPDVEVEGFNPLCGDELKMRLRLEAPAGAADGGNGRVARAVGADHRIAEVQIEPNGCSISVASASMLAQQLTGRTIAEVMTLKETFKEVMRGGDWPEGTDFGDLEALEGVKNFPVRIKCALLAWMTLEQALAQLAPDAVGEIEIDADIEVRTAG